MPSQAEKAWARRKEPQVFALNMCPGKSASLPAHPLTLLGSLAQKAPPSRAVKNKSCLWEALRQTGQPRDWREASGPKKGEDQIGQEAGLGSRDQQV